MNRLLGILVSAIVAELCKGLLAMLILSTCNMGDDEPKRRNHVQLAQMGDIAAHLSGRPRLPSS
jgi:hypothetical protein